MLQHQTTSQYTHFNSHLNDSENRQLVSNSHLGNKLQQRRSTTHVPPLPSSALCSNNHKLSSISDSSVLSPKYHQQQQTGYHDKQYVGVEQQQQQQQQTLTADKMKSIGAPTVSTTPTADNDESFSNTDCLDDTSLVNLGRRLRTNLSLAKQRMMMELKQSTEPSDIAIYTQLESITLDDSSSHSAHPSTKTKTSSKKPTPKSKLSSSATTTLPRIVASTVISKTIGNGRNLFSHHSQYPAQPSKAYNKHRVHKKKPYNSNSSYMELQTNSNGYVSVVLRKKSAPYSKDSFATLSRSFSFNIGDSDDTDSDDDSDNGFDDDNTSNAKNNGDGCADPITPVLDSLCDGDTGMGGSSLSLDQLTTIAPIATTTPATLNPYTWTSPPSTSTIGFNMNEQDIGMNWNMGMMEMLSPTLTEDMEYAWQQQGNYFDENKPMELEQQPDENAIDSWLQRGGFGYGPLVAATDQELADLLDFDQGNKKA